MRLRRTRRYLTLVLYLALPVLAAYYLHAFARIYSWPIVGIVLVVIHGFMKNDAVFDSIGTGLLIAALPMILIGSIFLDMINEKNV